MFECNFCILLTPQKKKTKSPKNLISTVVFLGITGIIREMHTGNLANKTKRLRIKDTIKAVMLLSKIIM